jgi:hypothetical protein
MTTTDVWKAHFGELPPVGHELRAALRDRWLRIHSLPDSKRYADNDAEYAELLRRHYLVAGEILGEGREVILGLHANGNERDLHSSLLDLAWSKSLGVPDLPAVVFPALEQDDDAIVSVTCTVRWATGAWDALIRDVADWRAASVVLCNPGSGEVYAPYDGGADVIVANSHRVATLKGRWSEWLSTHPFGL